MISEGFFMFFVKLSACVFLGAFFQEPGLLSVYTLRLSSVFNVIGGNHDLCYTVVRRSLEHYLRENIFQYSAQTSRACFALNSLSCYLMKRFFRLYKYLYERVFVKLVKNGNDGESSHKLRYNAEFYQILRRYLMERFGKGVFLTAFQFRTEAERR